MDQPCGTIQLWRSTELGAIVDACVRYVMTVISVTESNGTALSSSAEQSTILFQFATISCICIRWLLLEHYVQDLQAIFLRHLKARDAISLHAWSIAGHDTQGTCIRQAVVLSACMQCHNMRI